MNYIIVIDSNPKVVEQEVERLLLDGYRPLGGIAVATSETSGYERPNGDWNSGSYNQTYAQAMMRQCLLL